MFIQTHLIFFSETTAVDPDLTENEIIQVKLE